MAELRVLHLIQCLYGYGAERQVRELLRCLQGRDMVVAAATVYPSGLSEDELCALPFPTYDMGRRNRADYTFLPKLVSKIREFDPDIVHTHTHSGKYWGRIAAWLAGVKHVVYTEHNPCDPRRGRVARAIDPLLHACTTRIVTFSLEQRNVLAETQHVAVGRIVIIPNGLPALPQAGGDGRRRARQLLDVPEGKFAIFLIGRFTAQKNQALALRAIATLEPEERERLILFFAGSGADEAILRSLARVLDVERHVRFLGYRDDLQQLLPGADLLLSTSLFEGMPLTLIEAMAAGVPIVSTPWTGASEMLANGSYGFIVPGWEPERVAAEIFRARTHPRARSEMAARAYAYASKAFTIARTAQEHRRLYSEICASGGRA